MCDYCGCSEIPAVAELIREHDALVDQAGHIRLALSEGRPGDAMSGVTLLVEDLTSHVRREEEGIFRAIRDSGEFVGEVADLEEEHRDLEAAIEGLDAGSSDFGARVERLLDDLDVHVQREELGIFPVSAVTLGASGWDTVEESHARTPTFLRYSVTGSAAPLGEHVPFQALGHRATANHPVRDGLGVGTSDHAPQPGVPRATPLGEVTDQHHVAVRAGVQAVDDSHPYPH